jgi:hypothetical protein
MALGTSLEEYELDGAQFPRAEKRGVLLGMDWLELAVFGSGAFIGLLGLIILGFPYGLLILLPLLLVSGGLCVFRISNRSVLRWGLVLLRHGWRGLRGQNDYGRPMFEVSENDRDFDARFEKRTNAAKSKAAKLGIKINTEVPKPASLNLPGEANELKLYEAPNGAGVIYDPVERTAAFVAAVSGRGFPMADASDKAEWTENWDALLTSLAGTGGVEYCSTMDRTTVVSGAKIREYYLTESRRNGSGQQLNAEAHRAYIDLLSESGQSQHESFVGIVLSKDKLLKEIRANGGGIAGLLKVCAARMDMMTMTIGDCGVVTEGWLTPRQVGRLVRTAFSPGESTVISERQGESAGVAPQAAGPMFAKRSMSTMITDTGLHRSWIIAEWPRSEVKPGFIESLVFAGDFRHTVTQIARPIPATKAIRRVEGDLRDFGASQKISTQVGREQGYSELAEGSDLQRRVEELTAGHGEVEFAGFVTVSGVGDDEEQMRESLENGAAAVMYGASRAGCDLRVLYGQQFEGFLAGALPLGRGLK